MQEKNLVAGQAIRYLLDGRLFLMVVRNRLGTFADMVVNPSDKPDDWMLDIETGGSISHELVRHDESLPHFSVDQLVVMYNRFRLLTQHQEDIIRRDF